MKRLLRDRSARLGLIIIALLILCAVFAMRALARISARMSPPIICPDGYLDQMR